MPPEATIREYLDRMVPLQEVADRTREHLQGIRREARSDGINLDALNALLPVLSKYRNDKGRRVLEEIVRYAEVFGTKPPETEETGPTHLPRGSIVEGDGSEQSEEEACSRHKSVAKTVMLGPLRLSARAVFALCLSGALIWLLN